MRRHWTSDRYALEFDSADRPQSYLLTVSHWEMARRAGRFLQLARLGVCVKALAGPAKGWRGHVENRAHDAFLRDCVMRASRRYDAPTGLGEGPR